MSMRNLPPVSAGPMLNAYPDSLGGTMRDIVRFLDTDVVRGAFATAYILPSLFNTDLDRGFSVIDYSLNELYAASEDLDTLKALGVELKLDFILNHASVLSPQFQDLGSKRGRIQIPRFLHRLEPFLGRPRHHDPGRGTFSRTKRIPGTCFSASPACRY